MNEDMTEDMNINQLTAFYLKLGTIARYNTFIRREIVELQNKIIMQIGILYINKEEEE